MSRATPWILLVGLMVTASWQGAMAQPIVKYYPHTGVMETVSPSGNKAFLDFLSPSDTMTASNITFNFFIEDRRQNTGIGFDGPNGGAALARTKEALAYIADVLNIPATRSLDILLSKSETDGTGFLASAGSFFSAANGFFDGSAFTRLTTGIKPFANSEEIGVTVDFGFNWNFTTGAPGQAQVDYLSVILHEMTHGLGIASLAIANGNSAFAQQFGTQTFTSWDNLLRRGDGGTRVWSGNPPAINNLADLTSDNLFFNGAQARAMYGQAGAAAGVFAPATFLQGSSIGHWDTGNIVGGAVMEHEVLSGVQRRAYAPLEIGALIDLGYTNAAEGEGEGEGEGDVFCDVLSVNITSPTANIDLDPNETSALVTFSAQALVENIANCVDGTLQVTYSIGGQTIGSSSNPNTGFAVTENLGAGSYTVVATATLVETGTMVVDQQSFSVIANQAVPDIGVLPNAAGGFNFGNVNDTAVRNQTFTVENLGGGTLTGSATAAGAGFGIVGASNYSLSSGQTATITVRFSPGGPGTFQGTLSFSGDPDGVLQLVLLGTGVKTGFFGCGAAGPGAAGSDALVAGCMALLLVLASLPARRRRMR